MSMAKSNPPRNKGATRSLFQLIGNHIRFHMIPAILSDTHGKLNVNVNLLRFGRKDASWWIMSLIVGSQRGRHWDWMSMAEHMGHQEKRC